MPTDAMARSSYNYWSALAAMTISDGAFICASSQPGGRIPFKPFVTMKKPSLRWACAAAKQRLILVLSALACARPARGLSLISFQPKTYPDVQWTAYMFS